MRFSGARRWMHIRSCPSHLYIAYRLRGAAARLEEHHGPFLLILFFVFHHFPFIYFLFSIFLFLFLFFYVSRFLFTNIKKIVI